MRRERIILLIGTMIIIILLMIAYIEEMPYEIVSSTNFTSGNILETKLYVVANTLLPIDRLNIANEIVEWHTKVNGYDANRTYEIEIYRTKIHYNRFKKYDTIYCDANGNIF